MTATTVPPAVGRHRWDKGGPVDHLGRRTITEPASPDHRLTPAAYQTHTRTHQQVPATVDQPTGLLFPRDVTSTNQWTVTAAAERGVEQDGGEQ